jgi:hypothetical protein
MGHLHFAFVGSFGSPVQGASMQAAHLLLSQTNALRFVGAPAWIGEKFERSSAILSLQVVLPQFAPDSTTQSQIEEFGSDGSTWQGALVHKANFGVSTQSVPPLTEISESLFLLQDTANDRRIAAARQAHVRIDVLLDALLSVIILSPSLSSLHTQPPPKTQLTLFDLA